ncbi:MAG: hypothetical protein R2940_13450 [Syntrophotaleaceae bacterium]
MDKVIFLSLIVLIFVMPEKAGAQRPLQKGYLLVQFLSTKDNLKGNEVHNIKDAKEIFSKIEGKIDGLEFYPIKYTPEDVELHRSVAQEAEKFKIDLWISSWRLTERFLQNYEIPCEFQAYVMKPDGTIIKAKKNGSAVFDKLNPAAVQWFLREYEEKYLRKMQGLVSGYFFNEDHIPYLGKRKNNLRFNYWETASYSPAVYSSWKSYCVNNGVYYRGKIVDKFPVSKPEMVPNGKGQTKYFPGYDVPEKIKSGQKFVDIAKPTGVWKAWYDFLCEQFLKNWIEPVAEIVNKNNSNNPEWYGVMYFGLHQWLLSYHKIEDPSFKVSKVHNLGAWGRERGVDLLKLSKSPFIDFISLETLPPIQGANIESFVKEFKSQISGSDKNFGLMVHRDDRWKMSISEEKERWLLINKYKPDIILRYKLHNMIPGGEYFSSEIEKNFMDNLKNYKKNNNLK